MDRKTIKSIFKDWMSVQEKNDRSAHYKGATKPEGLLDKEGEGSKKFAKDHTDKMKVDDTLKKSHDDVVKAGRVNAGKSHQQAPSRSGTDKLDNGDKQIVKSTQAEGVELDEKSDCDADYPDGNAKNWKKSKRTVVDKGGNKHDPMSRAQHLSRLGLRKQTKKVKEGTEETGEDIQELKKSTYASYIKKASKSALAKQRIAKDFENDEYHHMGKANDHHPNNIRYDGFKKDPEKLKHHQSQMKTAAKLKKDFERGKKNRVKGIARAADKLSK